jgi:hypothetical protein
MGTKMFEVPFFLLKEFHVRSINHYLTTNQMKKGMDEKITFKLWMKGHLDGWKKIFFFIEKSENLKLMCEFKPKNLTNVRFELSWNLTSSKSWDLKNH